MTVARHQARGLETRDRILAIALREFAARGYAAVTIEEIAAAAEVTKGAVYYWFANKDDLGRELQHGLYDRLTTMSLQSLDPEADLVTNMRNGFHVYLEALGDLGEARFFLRDAWTIPALDEAGRRDHEVAAEMMRDTLATAMRRGEVVKLDPDALARVLLGAWAEATLHMLSTGERASTVAVIEHLLEGLRPVGSVARRRRTTTTGGVR